MANNYTGYNYGGAHFNSGSGQGTYGANSVAYPAVTNATYANAAAYQSAVAAGGGSYAGGGAGNAATAGSYGAYGNDFSRAASLQAYDSTKTFYQQAASNYNTNPTATGKALGKAHYSAPPVKNVTPIGTKPAGGKEPSGAGAAVATAAAAGAYSSYDAALYSAATAYVNQPQQPGPGNPKAGWTPFRKGGPGPAGKQMKPKQPPRPQQLHYCEVCKISCAGPQTYREHLEGQKHKKREASLKLQASAQTTAVNRGNNYHCELCDVTCTGTDAYAAHVRGAKHQKVVKLHQKLGKPIPSEEPKKMTKINFVPASGGNAAAAAGDETNAENNADDSLNDGKCI